MIYLLDKDNVTFQSKKNIAQSSFKTNKMIYLLDKDNVTFQSKKNLRP